MIAVAMGFTHMETNRSLLQWRFRHQNPAISMIDIQLLRKDIDNANTRLADRNFQLDVATFNALEA